MKITKTQEVTLDLSPQDAADLFCNFDEDEQAEFFNKISVNVKIWKSAFCFQLQEITDSKHLTNEGRKIMREIGEYAYNTK